MAASESESIGMAEEVQSTGTKVRKKRGRSMTERGEKVRRRKRKKENIKN
jgi:hypothetical protein